MKYYIFLILLGVFNVSFATDDIKNQGKEFDMNYKFIIYPPIMDKEMKFNKEYVDEFIINNKDMIILPDSEKAFIYKI